MFLAENIDSDSSILHNNLKIDKNFFIFKSEQLY